MTKHRVFDFWVKHDTKACDLCHSVTKAIHRTVRSFIVEAIQKLDGAATVDSIVDFIQHKYNDPRVTHESVKYHINLDLEHFKTSDGLVSIKDPEMFIRAMEDYRIAHKLEHLCAKPASEDYLFQAIGSRVFPKAMRLVKALPEHFKYFDNVIHHNPSNFNGESNMLDPTISIEQQLEQIRANRINYLRDREASLIAELELVRKELRVAERITISIKQRRPRPKNDVDVAPKEASDPEPKRKDRAGTADAIRSILDDNGPSTVSEVAAQLDSMNVPYNKRYLERTMSIRFNRLNDGKFVNNPPVKSKTKSEPVKVVVKASKK